MRNILLSILLVTVSTILAQYAPAAGQAGSGAISKDSSIIVSWATNYSNYILGTDVDTTWQHAENALGQAEGTSGDIVSLGRGGEITLSFDTLIINGTGADFATFENSFTDNFLELAYVEVSFDGVNFERFPNYSETQESVDAFGTVEPTKIMGYCSKYRQGYGTPFDLDNVLLDTIKFIRIVDIIGDGTYFDSNNHPIYDPYPTTGSAGVDIDAVAVINAGARLSSVHNLFSDNIISVYPNPAKEMLNIKIESNKTIKNVSIIDVSGRTVKQIHNINTANTIDISDIKKGVYFIKINIEGKIISKKFIKL